MYGARLSRALLPLFVKELTSEDTMTITELRARLQEAGLLERYAEVTESQAPRCVRFRLVAADENEMAPGDTRLGGSPDLSVGSEWPTYRGRPLDFIMQVNLQDLSHYRCCNRLPPEGYVYFFYDAENQPDGQHPSHRGRWRVVFHPGPTDVLERVHYPKGGCSTAPLKTCRIDSYEALSPGWEEVAVDALRLDDHETVEYLSFIETLPVATAHQVLGRPGYIQTFERLCQLDCQFVANGLELLSIGTPIDQERAKELEPGAADWKLLLQLDSDEDVGMKWKGSGLLTFWIREQDLSNCDFRNVWVLTQVL
jgi:uncharacterized protein YwqG